MARLRHEAWKYHETDPDRAYALYDEAHRLARRFREPWWTLFYLHRRVEALLFFKRDYRDVLRPAVEAVLEVRKPVYADFPFRFAVYYDLLSAYLGIDPVGCLREVRDALGCLEAEARDGGDDRCLLEDCKSDLAMALGDLDGTEAAYLRMTEYADAMPQAEGPDHYKAYGYCGLCRIVFERGQWDRLADHAAAGEQAARRIGYQMPLAEYQLWQALLARRAGEDGRALALRRQALTRVDRLKKPPTPFWFDALCAWALLDDDVAAAVRVREQEVRVFEGSGQFRYECDAHVERCRLLARTGRPPDDALAAACAAAGKLRDPAPRLAELDALEGGGTGR
jgi:hypothetical protein